MDNVLQTIINHYLESDDYNGLHISHVLKLFPNIKVAKKTICQMIDAEQIAIAGFIKHFPFIDKNEQIKRINEIPDKYVETTEKFKMGPLQVARYSKGDPCHGIYFYPTEQILDSCLGNNRKYLELPPFSKMLVFGRGQLELLYFRIDVLDRFIEDPRYQIRYGDYLGDINLVEEDPLAGNGYLKHFGLASNKRSEENLICAFIGDLARLSSQHQYHFYGLMMQEALYYPDYDFYKNMILCEFSERISIFRAFLEEIVLINRMTMEICQIPFFKHEYSLASTERPNNFHPFQKPTLKSFNNFCCTLDKMFTDNISKDFFVHFFKKYPNIQNQYVIGKNLGSLGLLTVLISHICKFPSDESKREALSLVVNVWKNKIRTTRSKEAHYITNNNYDVSLFSNFGQILHEAYTSIRTLRLLLSNHPAVISAIKSNKIQISGELYTGQIRSFFARKENNM